MIPSVGRIVHYVSAGSKDGKYPSACRAAIITETVDMGTGADPIVGMLMVCNPTGIHFVDGPRHDEFRKEPMTWHWPEGM